MKETKYTREVIQYSHTRKPIISFLIVSLYHKFWFSYPYFFLKYASLCVSLRRSGLESQFRRIYCDLWNFGFVDWDIRFKSKTRRVYEMTELVYTVYQKVNINAPVNFPCVNFELCPVDVSHCWTSSIGVIGITLVLEGGLARKSPACLIRGFTRPWTLSKTTVFHYDETQKWITLSHLVVGTTNWTYFLSSHWICKQILYHFFLIL